MAMPVTMLTLRRSYGHTHYAKAIIASIYYKKLISKLILKYISEKNHKEFLYTT